MQTPRLWVCIPDAQWGGACQKHTHGKWQLHHPTCQQPTSSTPPSASHSTGLTYPSTYINPTITVHGGWHSHTNVCKVLNLKEGVQVEKWLICLLKRYYRLLIKVHNDLLRALDNGCGLLSPLGPLSSIWHPGSWHSAGQIRQPLSVWRSPPVDALILAWQVTNSGHRWSEVWPIRSSVWYSSGSVLGPILFTIHTIPIGAIARLHNLEVHIHADDTQLYIIFKMKDPISQ